MEPARRPDGLSARERARSRRPAARPARRAQSAAGRRGRGHRARGSTSRSSIPPAAWTSATRRRRSRRWSVTTCCRPSGTSWTSRTIGFARSRMAGCSRPRRRLLHRAVAEALETAGSGSPARHGCASQGSARRANRAARPSRAPRRIVGEGRALSPAGRRRRRPRGRRFRTLGCALPRPSMPSSRCRRVGPHWSRPSRFASSCGRC